jgi:hypothetical protein
MAYGNTDDDSPWIERRILTQLTKIVNKGGLTLKCMLYYIAT